MPTSDPQQEGHQKSANGDAGDKDSDHPQQHLAPANANGRLKTKTAVVLFLLIDGGIVWLFWGFSGFFGEHNHPSLSTVFFFLFVATVLAGFAGAGYSVWPRFWPICGIFVALVIVAAIVIHQYSRPMTEIPTTKTAEWQPPELPADCERVTFSLGKGLALSGSPSSYTNWPLFVFPSGSAPLHGLVTNNRLYVIATSTYPVLWPVVTNIVIRGLSVTTLPPFWHVNRNSNALEIVDNEYRPIYQVIYQSPDHVQVMGIFWHSNEVYSCGTNGHSSDPSNATIAWLGLKPIFKYPEWKHRGEFAEERQEDPYSGVLEPANDPLPFPNVRNARSVSDFQPNSVFLFLGSSVINFGQTKSPCVVWCNGDCIVSIEEQNGTAFLSGQFFDESGKIIAVLSSNRFDVDQQNVFRSYRPDKSTLILRDHRNVEVLNLRYLARSAFMLTGVIRLPDKKRIVITKEYIEHPTGGRLQGCTIQAINVGGTAAAFVVCEGAGISLGVTNPRTEKP